ncbi:MAG: BTAD domain-containing putative transcriptional regulator [Bacillota bacterium]
MANTILKTRFIPPKLQRETWEKNVLKNEFYKISSYPLSIIKAGPGYGKSIMLADYFRKHHQDNYAWYSINEFDKDAAIFIENFIAGLKFSDNNTGSKADEYLDINSEQSLKFRAALDVLLNEILENKKDEFYYILDDVHLLDGNKQIEKLLNYFIKNLPPNFHLVLSGRHNLKLDDFINWQLKNQVYIIDSATFSLSSEEIKEFLKHQYNLELTETRCEDIYNRTEGWLIAVDLVGRGIYSGQSVEEILSLNTSSSELLFQYLAKEVLQEMDQEKIQFLYQTSILQMLDFEIVNKFIEEEQQHILLQELEENSIFVSKFSDNQYRYHSLFQEFLQQQAAEHYDMNELHKKAAEITEEKGLTGYAIYHSLAAEEYEQTVSLIIESAEKLLQHGRIETFQLSLDQLPQQYFLKFPILYLFQGDIYRLKSDFNGALNSFHEARNIFARDGNKEMLVQALEKLAMVYLDTVQPAKADRYLQEALKLKEEDNPWQEVELLYLMAENKINEGQYQEAEKYRNLAEKSSYGKEQNDNFKARVQLRTGRLEEALIILKEKLAGETENNKIPKSHRETVLLLSLINSFLGKGDSALETAHSGEVIIKNFSSPFTEAVVNMRLGHAFQLKGEREVEKAINHYQRSLELVEDIGVERGKAEPLMGLSLLEAFYGDPRKGEEYARQGSEIVVQAGDKWLNCLLLIAMGINQYQQKNYEEAEASITTAREYTNNSYDVFSRIITDYWLAVIHQETKNYASLNSIVKEMVALTEKHNMIEILRDASLFTSRDPDLIIPALLYVKRDDSDPGAVGALLNDLGYGTLEHHPGYSLKIDAFGRLRIFRGYDEITKDDWKREKARELFLLFLVNWGDLLSREYICDQLWPDSDFKSAKKSFKVVLNSLKNTLEPNREVRQEPYFISRENSHYGLNPEASYIYDVNEFRRWIEKAKETVVEHEKIEYYLKAAELYHGDFLAEEVYYAFTLEERERYKISYLNFMDEILNYYYKKTDYEKCIHYCNQILQIDLAWEKAYYYLMLAYINLSRRSMAIKTYIRCRNVLQEELAVEPGVKIKEIYQKLVNKN